MAIQMTVTLTEQQYAVLRAEAARKGLKPDALVLDMIQRLPSVPEGQHSSEERRPLTGRELAEQQYREGKLSNLATQRPLDPEEEAERERLGRLFASDQLMSDMVIEDRGPY